MREGREAGERMLIDAIACFPPSRTRVAPRHEGARAPDRCHLCGRQDGAFCLDPALHVSQSATIHRDEDFSP